MYVPYANEILLGKVCVHVVRQSLSFYRRMCLISYCYRLNLKHFPREKIQLATKFGVEKVNGTGVVGNGKTEYVRACCEASLERLGVHGVH